MIDETVSAQAEGEALPAQPLTRAVWAAEKAAARAAMTDVERALAAVEHWYAAHFHAAAVAGRAPITADDKAALIQHVTDAVAPTATKE